jgi:acetoin utilization protein AcuC
MRNPEKCHVGFLWSPLLETFDFGRKHPIRVGRFKMIRDFVDSQGFLNSPNVSIITPQLLPDELLRTIHSEEYIQKVQSISETGVGDIDIDTPGFKDIYFNSRIVSGASVTGVKSVLSNSIDHFVSPTGGFHHARYDRGGGFCIFNDVAASVYQLKHQGIERVLIADFDVHHGNGTQSYFYEDPGVMQISFHEDPEWMYPHDGFIHDIGKGASAGLNINMHFPMDSGDAVYKYAFDEIVPPLIDFYQPEFILFIPGFDAHYLDRLAHLKLTTKMTRYITKKVHAAAHKFCKGMLGVMTGGGYHPDSLLWGMGTVISELSGIPYEPPPQNPPFEDNQETWDEVKHNVSEVKQLVFPLLGI